jgi:hypothetical protein
MEGPTLSYEFKSQAFGSQAVNCLAKYPEIRSAVNNCAANSCEECDTAVLRLLAGLRETIVTSAY